MIWPLRATVAGENDADTCGGTSGPVTATGRVSVTAVAQPTAAACTDTEPGANQLSVTDPPGASRTVPPAGRVTRRPDATPASVDRLTTTTAPPVPTVARSTVNAATRRLAGTVGRESGDWRTTPVTPAVTAAPEESTCAVGGTALEVFGRSVCGAGGAKGPPTTVAQSATSPNFCTHTGP